VLHAVWWSGGPASERVILHARLDSQAGSRQFCVGAHSVPVQHILRAGAPGSKFDNTPREMCDFALALQSGQHKFCYCANGVLGYSYTSVPTSVGGIPKTVELMRLLKFPEAGPLYKSNAVVTRSLKPPGCNPYPCAYAIIKWKPGFNNPLLFRMGQLVPLRRGDVQSAGIPSPRPGLRIQRRFVVGSSRRRSVSRVQSSRGGAVMGCTSRIQLDPALEKRLVCFQPLNLK
jgi:hypothetical protein